MPAPLDDELAYLTALRPGAAALLRSLARPALRLTDTGHAPTSATSSYVGGHPYLPHGTAWPVDAEGRARVFVAQVDFAALPPLRAFPTSGLLQWFVTDEDGHGLADAEDRDRTGLAVRWWPADRLGEPCDPPSTPRPRHDVDPVVVDRPVALAARPVLSMPPLDELEELAGLEGLADDADDAEEAAGTEAPWVGNGSKVGGYPHTVQVAPVASVPFAGEEPDPASRLLLQLDSDVDRWTEWGDVGTAQLFGDPEALARGDVSSLWWHWAC